MLLANAGLVGIHHFWGAASVCHRSWHEQPSAPRGLADGITKTIIAFGVLSDQFDLVFEMRRYFGLDGAPTLLLLAGILILCGMRLHLLILTGVDI